MHNRAAKILISYAGLLIMLGAALAAATGFHNGWRLVGMNVAVACALAAACVHVGSTRRIALLRRAGKLAGLILTFAASINFARLAFKWHRSALDLPVDAAIAALMAAAGFVAAVLLWRTMRAALAARWAQRVHQLAAVTGMAAMAGGLLMIKFASTPQAATAVTQSTRALENLMLDAADSAIGERVIDAALDNEQVLSALEQRGVTADQARQLADDPDLRAAALDLLRGNEVELPADRPAAQPPSPSGPATSVARNNSNSNPIPITADDLLAHFSRDELRQLARTYNGSLRNLEPNALISIDPAQLEPYLDDPQVRRALDRLGMSPDDLQPATGSASASKPRRPAAQSAHAGLPAVRWSAPRIDDRSPAARVNTRAAADPRVIDLDDQPDSIAASTAAARETETTLIPGPELFARRSLLDQADPVQQRVLGGSVDEPVDRASASMTREDSAAQPTPATDAQRRASVAEARALAEVIRAEVIEPAAAGGLPVPETRSWAADPGLFLTRTGTVALVIGACVLLCAIAAGSRRTSPQPAV